MSYTLQELKSSVGLKFSCCKILFSYKLALLVQTWIHSFSFAGFYNHKSYGNCAVSRFKGWKTGLSTSINSAKVIIFMQIHYKSSFIMCFKELSKCLKTFLAWEIKVVELKHLKFWDIKIRNRFYAYFSFISEDLNLKMHFWI